MLASARWYCNARVWASTTPVLVHLGGTEKLNLLAQKPNKGGLGGGGRWRHEPYFMEVPPIGRRKKSKNEGSNQGPLAVGFVSTEVPAWVKAKVPTGIACYTTPGTYGRIADRSGMAWKHDL